MTWCISAYGLSCHISTYYWLCYSAMLLVEDGLEKEDALLLMSCGVMWRDVTNHVKSQTTVGTVYFIERGSRPKQGMSKRDCIFIRVPIVQRKGFFHGQFYDHSSRKPRAWSWARTPEYHWLHSTRTSQYPYRWKRAQCKWQPVDAARGFFLPGCAIHIVLVADKSWCEAPKSGFCVHHHYTDMLRSQVLLRS